MENIKNNNPLKQETKQEQGNTKQLNKTNNNITQQRQLISAKITSSFDCISSVIFESAGNV